MHSAVRCTAVVAAALVSVLTAHAAVAQDFNPAAAISAVMAYRLTYLADSTPFDGCTVARQLGGARPDSRLDTAVRHLLDSTSEPCPRPRQPGRSHVVLVDSVAAAGSVAHVHLTVLRDGYLHREDFTVRRLGTGEFRGVREVRIWGARESYAGRRSTGR
jgi:hypothetical protein